MEQKPPTSDSTPKTILVADDDEAILKFISLLLTQSGYQIIAAQSGEEALKQSKEHTGPIHLLLSNIQMPEMTGIELGTKIAQQRPEIKVMLMSGYASGMLVLNSGWQFLHKPFVPTQLRDLISTLLTTSIFPSVPDLDEHKGKLQPDKNDVPEE